MRLWGCFPLARGLHVKRLGRASTVAAVLLLAGFAGGCEGPIWTSREVANPSPDGILESVACFLPGGEVLTTAYDPQAQATTFCVHLMTTGEVRLRHVAPGFHRVYYWDNLADGATARFLASSRSPQEQVSVTVWDYNTLTLVAALDMEGDNDAWSLAISPGARYVLVGSENGIARLYDLNQAEGPDKLFKPAAHLGTLHRQVTFATFSPDGRYAGIAAMYGPRAIIWDVVNGRVARDISIPQKAEAGATPSGWIGFVDIQYSNGYLLFDWQTGTTLCRIDIPEGVHLSSLSDPVYLPQQNRIVCLGAEKWWGGFYAPSLRIRGAFGQDALPQTDSGAVRS